MARTKPPGPKSVNLSVQEMQAAIPKIRRRIDELEAFDTRVLLRRDDPRIEALEKKVDNTLSDIFGHDSYELREYGGTEFDTLGLSWSESGHEVSRIQINVKEGIVRAAVRLMTLTEILMERIVDAHAQPMVPNAKPVPAPPTRKVFIVHGHDEGMKETVARYITTLNLDPIILHEKANEGKTIIEKFEQHALVDFAVVLFSPDDVGYAKGNPTQPRDRARQNVVLELGFFMGALKRHKVCVLVQENIEKPSDYDGVLYIPFDATGSWRFQLAKEMRASGIEIDMNKAV